MLSLEIVRTGIRYFIRACGWRTVAKIVREEKPPSPVKTTPKQESSNYPEEK